MMEIKRYRLLTDPLQTVATAADNSRQEALKAGAGDADIFSGWYENAGGYELGNTVIDERRSLAVVEKLMVTLEVLNVLGELPPAVAELKRAYDAMEDERDEYLRYALTIQRKRYLYILDKYESEKLDKKIENINRGCANRREKVETLKEEADKLTNTAPIEAPAVAPAMSTEELTNVHNRIIKELRRILVELDNMIENQEILELKKGIRDEVRALLKTTETDLAELGGPIDLAPKKVIPVRPERRAVNREPAPNGKKRKNRPKGSPGNGGTPPPSAEPQANRIPAEDNIDRSLKQLRGVISMANSQGRGCIRIIVPGAKIGSHSKKQTKWDEVMRMLGYAGEIEFVTYERLASTTDFDSPVIAPDGTYTHLYKWGAKKFKNMCVLSVPKPGVLKGRINGTQPSCTKAQSPPR